mmetsp:Transcript_11288/g.23105  ORF Transcript_11288/g.23105 Transcript_11288/m.23105 type:complete len:352 (+) Transcript_11288:155-1210(+)
MIITLLGKIGRKGNLFLGILCQCFTVPRSEFVARSGGIFGCVGPGPFQFQNQVIVTKSLQLFHGHGGIPLIDKSDKGKSSRFHGFLVFGQINTRNPSKMRKQFLQIGFSGIFGQVGDTNGVEIVHGIASGSSPTGRFVRIASRGRSPGASAHAGGNIATSGARSSRSCSASTSRRNLRPTIAGTFSWGSISTHIFAGDIVFAFQLASLLFGPERVQVLGKCISRIFILQISIGVGIFQNDFIFGLHGSLGAILFIRQGGTKLLPRPAFLHALGFLDCIAFHTLFRDGLDQELSSSPARLVRGNNLNTLFIHTTVVRGRHRYTGLFPGDFRRGGDHFLLVIFIIRIIGISPS